MKSVLVLATLALVSSAFGMNNFSPKGKMLYDVHKCLYDKSCTTPISVLIDNSINEYLNELPANIDKFESILEKDAAAADEVRGFLTSDDKGTNLERVYLRVADRIEKTVEEKKKLKEILSDDHADIKAVRSLQHEFAALETAISQTDLNEPKKALLEKLEQKKKEIYSVSQAARDGFDVVSEYLKGTPGEFWFLKIEISNEFRNMGDRCYLGSFGIKGGAGTFSLKDDKKIISKFINGPKSKRLSMECPKYPVGTPMALLKASYNPRTNVIRHPWKYDELLTFDPSRVGASNLKDIVELVRRKIK